MDLTWERINGNGYLGAGIFDRGRNLLKQGLSTRIYEATSENSTELDEVAGGEVFFV